MKPGIARTGIRLPVGLLSVTIASAMVATTTLQGTPAFARVVKPCVPGEPDHVLAEQELASIDHEVRSLAPGDNPEALVARIKNLGSSKCFEILDGVWASAKSGLSLKTYWDDGGFKRLRSALSLGGTGRRMFYTEPSVRRALTLETAPTSPIADILCPAADEACGAETAGWELRAEGLFKLAGRVGAESPRHGNDCEAAARAAPDSFAMWRECIEGVHEKLTPRRVSFPIGHTRAPKQGWLVITSRRGHYNFCDESRAYELATGSAYVIASCSELALEPGGWVNVERTNDARRLTIELGHLSLDLLREAAWMTLMLDELDRYAHGSLGTEVPPWLEARVDHQEAVSGSVIGGVVGSSSAHTRLRWDILGNDRLVKNGILTFPDHPNDVAADHAMRLIRIAELSFAAGCPAALPPDSVAGRFPRSSWDQASAKRAASCGGAR